MSRETPRATVLRYASIVALLMIALFSMRFWKISSHEQLYTFAPTSTSSEPEWQLDIQIRCIASAELVFGREGSITVSVGGPLSLIARRQSLKWSLSASGMLTSEDAPGGKLSAPLSTDTARRLLLAAGMVDENPELQGAAQDLHSILVHLIEQGPASLDYPTDSKGHLIAPELAILRPTLAETPHVGMLNVAALGVCGTCLIIIIVQVRALLQRKSHAANTRTTTTGRTRR